MNWVIEASPYNESVGGSIVLHRLADMLCRKGEKAYLTTDRKKPGWLGGFVDLLTMQLMEDCIYVGTEQTKLSRFNERFPWIRWVLYADEVYCGNGTFNPNEMLYVYLKYYRVNPNYTVHGILGVYDFKSGFFVDEGRERRGDCHTIRKGTGKRLDKHSEKSFLFDRNTPRSDEWLKETFNTCKRFVSYDDVTMLSLFAALCGCESVVVPGRLEAKEWRDKIPYLRHGIAYGDSQYELDRAKETRGEILPNLARLEMESSAQVDNMVSHVKEMLC